MIQLNKNSLEKDMKILAKYIRDLSKKHGGVYISASQCKGFDTSWVTYGEELSEAHYCEEVKE